MRAAIFARFQNEYPLVQIELNKRINLKFAPAFFEKDLDYARIDVGSPAENHHLADG